MEKLIIVGISTTADLAVEFIKSHSLYEVIGYAVNKEYKKTDLHNGLPVYELENLNETVPADEFKVFVAMLWNRLNSDRRKVYDFCKSKGYKFANLVSPTSIIRGEILGDNCWIHDYVIVQDSAKVYSDVMVMAFSLIGSRVVIGPHCFLGARSLIAGNCTIGEQTFVGLSSTVFDDTKIGKKCIIGACSAVKRNMPDFTRCKTASDAVDFKQYSEDEVESKLMFAKNVRTQTAKMGGVNA